MMPVGFRKLGTTPAKQSSNSRSKIFIAQSLELEKMGATAAAAQKTEDIQPEYNDAIESHKTAEDTQLSDGALQQLMQQEFDRRVKRKVDAMMQCERAAALIEKEELKRQNAEWTRNEMEKTEKGPSM